MSDEVEVPEHACVICAGDPAKRDQHFSADYVEIPFKGVCNACQIEFWEGICVFTEPGEESDSWKQAVREELKKPRASRRHGQEILDELRSRRPTKH